MEFLALPPRLGTSGMGASEVGQEPGPCSQLDRQTSDGSGTSSSVVVGTTKTPDARDLEIGYLCWWAVVLP